MIQYGLSPNLWLPPNAAVRTRAPAIVSSHGEFLLTQVNAFKNDADTGISESDSAFQTRVNNAPRPSSRQASLPHHQKTVKMSSRMLLAEMFPAIGLMEHMAVYHCVPCAEHLAWKFACLCIGSAGLM